jgi:hypothetical protein
MNHTCHWPGCKINVPPKLWGCKSHWFQLPKNLRSLIWRTYRPGQEITKTPSPEYIAAAHQVQEWIAQNGQEARERIATADQGRPREGLRRLVVQGSRRSVSGGRRS